MVTITVEYEGDLHCRAIHGPSGTLLKTDAPADNHGKAESFSPTDLVATALGSCLLSVMGIRAQALAINISGAMAVVDKEMVNVPTRRIQSLTARIHVPRQLTAVQREALEEAARGCPVYKAIDSGVNVSIDFSWG